jgi:hypothetical protein
MRALLPLLSLLPALAAAAPAAEVRPPRARPGDVVLVEVRGALAEPAGALAGRPLQFHAAGAGRWRAYAGLPVEAPPGPAAAEIAVGAAAPLAATLEVVEPGWPARALRVAPEFTAPKAPELEARVQADRAAFAAAYAHPPTPPLFSRPFAWPREAKVTARFGDRRTYNGETTGQHYGTDLAGPVGAPVRAANAGEVVLVRDAWASGLSVVLFHGANLYTVYFHLSAAKVEPGERVARGAVIGRLGASGRSTGPHLHWGARVGELYVDPESLLRLTASPPRSSRGR